MGYVIILLALLGIIASAYLICVEHKLAKAKNYKAACDINSKINCTAVANSKYAKTLGVPNAVLGLGFYGIVLVLAISGLISVVLYLSALAVLFTVYLIYVTYFKIKKVCVVCHLTYVFNFLLLFFSALK